MKSFKKSISCFLAIVMLTAVMPIPSFAVDSPLPTLSITLPHNTMQDIHDHKDTEREATFTITVPSGYTYEYGTGEEITDVTGVINGRGNTTWTSSGDKKPYAIKFDQAADVLGMGSARKWVLLSNALEYSRIRNKLVFDLANRANILYNVESVFVQLKINGADRGVYQLAEKVESGASRVNIDGGGFLLEIDAKIQSDEVGFITAHTGYEHASTPKKYRIHEPDVLENDATYTAIKQYVEDFEEALFEDNFYNTKYKRYDEYVDLQSLADNFLIQEFVKNVDAMHSSTFMYRNSSGKIFFGPFWDFDLTIKNTQASYYESNLTDGWVTTKVLPNSGWDVEAPPRTKHYTQLVKDQKFLDMVIARYAVLKPLMEDIYSANGEIDKLLASLTGTTEIISTSNAASDASGMKAFLAARIAWFDAHLKTTSAFYAASSLPAPPSIPYVILTGEGTSADPIIIDTEEKFDFISSKLATEDIYKGTLKYRAAHYRQTADLDMTKISTYNGSPNPGTVFVGTYDGGGHKINVNITNAANGDNNIFPYMSGTVMNLGTMGKISGQFVGGITRSMRESSSIINCWSTADIRPSGDSYTLGGIASSINLATSTISNCYFGGTITAGGNNQGAITGQANNGAIQSHNYSAYGSAGKSPNAISGDVISIAELNTIAGLMNGNIPTLKASFSGVRLASWVTGVDGNPRLMPIDYDATDGKARAEVVNFHFSGGTKKDKLDSSLGSKDGYFAYDGINSDGAILYGSVDGTDNKREFEWADSDYAFADGMNSATVAVMPAGSKNPWSSDQVNSPSYFEAKLSTTGFTSLKFSARMGGSKKGLNKYKLQYSTDGSTYTDVGGTYTITSNKNMWLAFDDVALPSVLDNQETVYLRMVSAGNTIIDSGTMSDFTGGENAINDVIVTGEADVEMLSLSSPSASVADGGHLFNGDEISLFAKKPEHTIFYSIDGGEAVEYTDAISVDSGFASTVTLSAWVNDGVMLSDAVTYTYKYFGDRLANFAFTTQPQTLLGDVAGNGILPSKLSASADKTNKFIPLFDDKNGRGVSISPDDGVKWQKGGYWQFEISTSGYEAIKMDARAASSQQGPNSYDIEWSDDGVNFHKLKTAEVIPFGEMDDYLLEEEFPADINNLEKAYIRFVINENKRAEGVEALFNNESKGNAYINDVVFYGTKTAPTMPVINKQTDLFGLGEDIAVTSADGVGHYVLKDSGGAVLAKGTDSVTPSDYILYGSQPFELTVWTAGDGANSVEHTRSFRYRGAEFVKFNGDEEIADSVITSLLGGAKLSMYPNGTVVAAMADISYVPRYGIRVQAVDTTNEWLGNMDGNGGGYWLIEASTEDYKQISMSLKQTSSDKGPRDFAVRYSTDNQATWTAIPNSAVRLERELNNSYIDFVLPPAVDNQEKVFIKIEINGRETMQAKELAEEPGSGNTGLFEFELCGIPTADLADDITVAFADSNGNVIANIGENTAGRAFVSVKKNEPVDVYAAEYKGNRLMKLTKYSLAADADRQFVNHSFDNLTEADYVKILVWKGGSMRPFGAPRTLNK